jgi:DNA-binding transcriptional LysR family regulator
VKEIYTIVQRVNQALPDLSIRQLEYLVAVSTAPSWSIAADSVGVSASALSQGLAELERRVGVSLFDRNGRRRTLRHSAEPVLAHARQVVALTGDLANWAERVRSGRSGRLRVGMIDAAAVGHYPNTLRQFRDDHDDLNIMLRVAPSGALLDLVETGDLDMAVCVAPTDAGKRPGIELEELFVEPLAVFTPTGRLNRDPARWGPWVLFATGSHTRAVIEAALVELGVPLDIVAESNQPEVLRTMVSLGVGATALPVVQAGDLAPGKVISERRLVIATRRGAASDPAVEMLTAALRAETSPSPSLSRPSTGGVPT